MPKRRLMMVGLDGFEQSIAERMLASASPRCGAPLHTSIMTETAGAPSTVIATAPPA